MFRIKDDEAPFEILIQTNKTELFKRFESISSFYRALSKSNQTVGISSPTRNHTNRKWWKFHFTGGFYFTYSCDDALYIHFVLDRRNYSPPPSDMQIKMRIIKAFKGYKPIIWSGINNKALYRTAYKLRECYTDIQYIGDRYNREKELPF
jgi:hypothetical protein